jgi:hypothetical protein
LTSHLERMVVSKKLTEDDLSRVEESATKSTYKLDVGFERCEDKSEKSAPKFIPSSNYHKAEETIKSTKAHYLSNPNSSFNPKRYVKKETLKLRGKAFVCMFYGCALRRGALSMIETHIVMSSLIFFALFLLSCFASHFFLCFASFLS